MSSESDREVVSIGVDPGAQSPAHCLSTWTEIATSDHPWRLPKDYRDLGVFVYVEGQQARRGSSRAGLMTLSRFAGMAIGAYLIQGAQVFVLSCDAWRGAFPELRITGNTDKLVTQRRARKAGHLPDVIWNKGPDYCDAELIRIAGERLRLAGKLPKPETWTRKCTKKKKSRPSSRNPASATTSIRVVAASASKSGRNPSRARKLTR